MYAYSPTGKLIVATADLIPGTAWITENSFTPGLNFEYAGETEIHWDDQYVYEEGNERFFIDEEGDLWKESEIALEEKLRA